MDADPGRQSQLMARWDMAGWAGAVAGPLLLAGVLAAGGRWRDGYLVLAAVSGLAWLGMLRCQGLAGACAGAGADADAEHGAGGRDVGVGVRDVLAAARRWSVLRWLVLLEVANWLVDVLTGFVAVYLVVVVHASPLVAAVAIALRMGAGLAGDALLIVALKRASDAVVLRGTAVAALLLYPGFLLVPGLAAKLVTLVLLSMATATWYPLLLARLYGTVPSSVAVTLSSAASMAGGVGPLAVGIAAGVLGLPWALAGLAVVPLVLVCLA